jgi:hypothetical protein
LAVVVPRSEGHERFVEDYTPKAASRTWGLQQTLFP